MISQDPDTRPSATEVLVDLSKSAVVNKQNTDNSTTDDSASGTVPQLLLVIESLKKEIAEKNLIIEKLTSGGASSVKIHVPGNIDTLWFSNYDWTKSIDADSGTLNAGGVIWSDSLGEPFQGRL
mgnify:CR=1 FL=1